MIGSAIPEIFSTLDKLLLQMTVGRDRGLKSITVSERTFWQLERYFMEMVQAREPRDRIFLDKMIYSGVEIKKETGEE